MAGYQTIEALRPILHRGPPPTPVVNRALVQPQAKLVQPRRSRYSDEQLATMRRLRASGKSYKFIGGVVGCSEDTVRAHTADVPLPEGQWMPGNRKRKHDRKAFAERLRRSGFTYAEIAEELGCCEGAAWNLINGRSQRRVGKKIAISRLVHNVARAMGLSSGDLRSRPNASRRSPPNVSKARFILYYIAYDRLGKTDERIDGMSLTNLGRSLGCAHHTSVLNGLRKVRAVVAEQNIDVSGGVQTIARRLWAATW